MCIKAVSDEKIVIMASDRGHKYKRDKKKIGVGKEINKIQKHTGSTKQRRTEVKETRSKFKRILVNFLKTIQPNEE